MILSHTHLHALRAHYIEEGSPRIVWMAALNVSMFLQKAIFHSSPSPKHLSLTKIASHVVTITNISVQWLDSRGIQGSREVCWRGKCNSSSRYGGGWSIGILSMASAYRSTKFLHIYKHFVKEEKKKAQTKITVMSSSNIIVKCINLQAASLCTNHPRECVCTMFGVKI